MSPDDAQVLELAGREVRITSPGKVMFPERGETKLDLVRYYAAVAEPLMRAMGGRPVLMQRFPQGAGGPSFFQKRVPESAPDWLETTTVMTVNGTPSRALVAADVAHVAWAVNLACLGFHVWPNRADDLEHADELRLDLDPQPGTAFAEARAAGWELKALLDELGVASFPKTTGNRGLHVYVRLEPRWDSYAVRSAAVAVARELERRRPDILTAAWWKEERGERIFVDYNQNAPHKTVFGAWSVRARRGGQVSTPLAWDELDAVEPDELTLATVPGRVERDGDPVGGHRRRPAVAGAAAGDARARPRERAARRPVAAGLPQAAGRAAARRAQPRAPRLIIPHANERGGSKMMCAVAVRKIRPDSYDEFRKAWQHDPWLPRYQKALVLRREGLPDEVMTMAFFDGTREEYEAARDEPETMRAEERRLRRISEVEEKVLLSAVFELVEEVLPPAE